MKFILALLLLMAGFANTAAQVRFFATVGVQSSHANEKNESPSWDTAYQPFFTNRGSLNLGLGTEWPIDSKQQFYLQSILRYSGKGRNFFRSRPEPLAQSTDTLSIRNNVALNYIEFPISINFKKRLKENLTFYAGAGFYGGFLFNGKIHQETRIYSTKKYTRDDLSVESGNAAGKYKTTDWGYIMNLGVEKNKFGLHAFIQNGLKSFYQQPGVKSIQHRVIGLSLNYFLSTLPGKVTIVIEKEKEKDSDSDGVGDSKDACPFEFGSQLTAGCPDADGDGVADKTDKCPSTKGLAKYAGCPIPDTDQDGIDDEKDSCVNLKGVPNYNGCPPPVLTDTIRKKFESIAAKIFFEYKSDSLKPSSVIELEELSNILIQNPHLILKIEGHTDNAGNQASNLQLSQQRAESVKSFFIQKGIDPSRLNAIGWGQEKPKASNETEEGRKMNRRVELLVEEKNQ